MIGFKEFVFESWLSLPSDTDFVESKLKHTAFFKSNVKDKANAFALAMEKSMTIFQVDNATKENPAFKSRIKNIIVASEIIVGK